MEKCSYSYTFNLLMDHPTIAECRLIIQQKVTKNTVTSFPQGVCIYNQAFDKLCCTTRIIKMEGLAKLRTLISAFQGKKLPARVSMVEVGARDGL